MFKFYYNPMGMQFALRFNRNSAKTLLLLAGFSVMSICLKAQCPTSITASGTATGGCEGVASPLQVGVTSPATPPTVVGGQVNPEPDIIVPLGLATGLNGASSSIPVTGGVGSVTATTDITVTLNINSDWDADMDIYLVGPGNCGTMELSTANGGNGKDYIGTVLSTNSTNIIGTLGNNTAPFTGNYAPEGATNVVPNLIGVGVGGGNYALPAADVLGCPINGNWTLWVFDHFNGTTDSNWIASWSINLGSCQYSYTYNVVAPVLVTGISSTTNTMQSNATITNLPVGVTNVSVTVSNGTATTVVNVPTKVYDKPVIQLIEVAPNCVVGPNATMTVTVPTIDNANFTGADIGIWNYSIDSINWFNTYSFAGLSGGTYKVYIRNSAKFACYASQVFIIIGAPTTAPNAGGLLKICEATTGITSASIGTVAGGGPPGLINYSNFTACTSNCTALDNNSIPCPPLISNSTIPGSGFITSTSIVSVTLNINCGWFSDLDVFLVGPGNCGTLELATDVGGTSDNFNNVTITTALGFPSITTIPVIGGFLQTNATFMAENTIDTPPNLLGPPGGNNPSAPNNGGNAYLTTPCLTSPTSPNSYVPNQGLAGCPVNGTWQLVIVDDWIAIAGTLLNWTLNISQADPNYSHLFTTTEPGVTIATNPVSGPSGQNGTATASNLPIGLTDVYVTSSRGGCSSPQDTITIKVYDRPNFNAATTTTTCAQAGTPGCISLSATLNNADFTGADIGVIQYGSSVAGPWTTLSGPICGLAAGAYTYYLRNSASPGAAGTSSCTSGPFNITVPTALPTIINLPTQIVDCSNPSATLTATPQATPVTQTNNSYVWSTAQTTNPIVVSPATNTLYCVTATSNVNALCKDTACTTVTVNLSTPPVAPTAIGDSVCISGNVTYDVITPNPCGGCTFSWYNAPVAGTVVGTGDPLTTSISANTTLYVGYTVGPCVSPLTAVTSYVFPVIATPLITVSPSPICVGTPATFTVTSPTGGVYTYIWYINGVPQGTSPFYTTSTTFAIASPVNGQSVTVQAFYYFP
jgi:subtilisin-like proprotein convertase family protein